MNLINYLLRTLVYTQSFFWLYLLFNKWKIKKYYDCPIIQILFVDIGIIVYFQILRYDISFSQYTPFLLSFYTLMVLLCYGIFSTKYYFKDAISLSFLIVFINSYYWESMYHLNAMLFYGVNFNQITQMFHLIPAYYLMKRIDFYDTKKITKKLLYGLIISGLGVSSIYVFNRLFNYSMIIIISPIVRLSTLYILIDIVLNDIKKIKKGV